MDEWFKNDLFEPGLAVRCGWDGLVHTVQDRTALSDAHVHHPFTAGSTPTHSPTSAQDIAGDDGGGTVAANATAAALLGASDQEQQRAAAASMVMAAQKRVVDASMVMAAQKRVVDASMVMAAQKRVVDAKTAATQVNDAITLQAVAVFTVRCSFLVTTECCTWTESNLTYTVPHDACGTTAFMLNCQLS